MINLVLVYSLISYLLILGLLVKNRKVIKFNIFYIILFLMSPLFIVFIMINEGWYLVNALDK